MLAGIAIYFFGAKILRKLVVPFLLLLLAIPIPAIIFNKIAFPLQIWASQAAVWGIRVFEVPSVRKGNVIELLPQRRDADRRAGSRRSVQRNSQFDDARHARLDPGIFHAGKARKICRLTGLNSSKILTFGEP